MWHTFSPGYEEWKQEDSVQIWSSWAKRKRGEVKQENRIPCIVPRSQSNWIHRKVGPWIVNPVGKRIQELYYY